MVAIQQQQEQIRQAQQVQQQQLTIDQRYIMTANQILPAIVPENPNYKDQVGTVLYEFVNQLVGQKAPKITGMLIDLPINDIQLIMQNYDLFKTRVGQANDLLAQQTGQATPQQQWDSELPHLILWDSLCEMPLKAPRKTLSKWQALYKL